VPEEQQENALELTDKELEEAEQRSSVRAHVVHEAVRKEGEEELKRPTMALAWSGLAAGLSMGFSLVTEGLLRSHLPDAPWRPLLSKLGYTVGFLMVILGRQQLFTENTLTAVLPVLYRRDRSSLTNMLRLWVVVLISNLIGALIFAWTVANTAAFKPEVRHAFLQIGQETMAVSFGNAILRGVFAGWLLATVVWLMPFAETGRVAVIIILTWLVGLGSFTHIIAGSLEAMFVAASGAATWQACVFGYMIPTLIGNTLGGVSLVAVVNHAQVVAGK
jgi:formate/nitrite transporter FocA (FNT family)